MEWFDVVVDRVVQESPVDRSLVLDASGASSRDLLAFRPGQHVRLREAPDDAPVGYYSLSSSPAQLPHLEVTIREAGDLGVRFYALEAGTRLRMSQPAGSFLQDLEPGRPLVLLAGGAGVTPYRALVRHLRETHATDAVTLVHAASAPARLLFHDELARHAGECGFFRYVPTVSGDADAEVWTGRRGRIDGAILESLIEDRCATVVYACGSNEFVDAMMELGETLALPPENLRRERWG